MFNRSVLCGKIFEINPWAPVSYLIMLILFYCLLDPVSAPYSSTLRVNSYERDGPFTHALGIKSNCKNFRTNISFYNPSVSAVDTAFSSFTHGKYPGEKCDSKGHG